MSWQSFKAPTVALQPATALASALQPLGDSISAVLKLTAEVIAVIDALENFVADPLAATVQAALAKIQSALDALLKFHAGIHFLPVPLIKPGRAPSVPTIPGDDGRDPAFSVIKLSKTDLLGSGGNIGFYNTVYDSVQDANDPFRPQYGSQDAVAGLVVLVGSTSLGEVVNALLALGKLLGPISVGMDANVVPVPQKLRAKVLPFIPGVELSWDQFESPMAVPGFSARFEAKNILLYRSDKPMRPSMPQSELDTKLLKMLPWNPLTTSYVDETAEADKTYYYAMAVRTELVEGDGVSTPIATTTLSNNVTVRMEDAKKKPTAHFSHGTPPDWIGLSVPLAMFEPVADLLLSLQRFVDSLSKSLGASETALKKLADNLKQMAATIGATIAGIEAQVQRIIAALSLPDAGIYAMTFAGTGGNNYFLNQLGKGLTDTSDPSAPPFTKGTEVTAGFICMVGASSLEALEDVVSFLSMVASGNGNPIQTLCDDAKKLLAPVFDDSMRPVAAGDAFPSPKPDPIC